MDKHFEETAMEGLVCEFANCKLEATQESRQADKNGFYRKFCDKHAIPKVWLAYVGK